MPQEITHAFPAVFSPKTGEGEVNQSRTRAQGPSVHDPLSSSPPLSFLPSTGAPELDILVFLSSKHHQYSIHGSKLLRRSLSLSCWLGSRLCMSRLPFLACKRFRRNSSIHPPIHPSIRPSRSISSSNLKKVEGPFIHFGPSIPFIL